MFNNFLDPTTVSLKEFRGLFRALHRPHLEVATRVAPREAHLAYSAARSAD